VHKLQLNPKGNPPPKVCMNRNEGADDNANPSQQQFH